jgi:tetratricopeptide (TPR) repeat protein
LILLTLAAACLCACATTPPQSISTLTDTYNQGNYAAAYEDGARLARSNSAVQRDNAAYIAGLSAQKLGRLKDAETYLRQAAASRDAQLAGDALASLGLVYAESARHDLAARELLRAADKLTDSHQRANAFLYAAISQQKLGQWAQAKTNLVLARNANPDPAFQRRIAEQLTVNGYALQTGAFSEPDNARRAAQQLASKAKSLRLGTPRLVQTVNRAGQSLTAVQVGEFATFAAAQDARDRLGGSAIIVPLAER